MLPLTYLCDRCGCLIETSRYRLDDGTTVWDLCSTCAAFIIATLQKHGRGSCVERH